MKRGDEYLKFIGHDYDNYARCKVDYSEEITEHDEFAQLFVITDGEGNVIGDDTDALYED